MVISPGVMPSSHFYSDLTSSFRSQRDSNHAPVAHPTTHENHHRLHRFRSSISEISGISWLVFVFGAVPHAPWGAPTRMKMV